jgi:putative membrane protein
MFKRAAVTLALVVFGLFIALGSGVVAQTNRTAPSSTSPTTSGQVSDIDRAFMMTAAEAGVANIQMGQLALQKASSQQVKQFAQAEISEQQAVSKELQRLAPQARVALPTTPGPKYQAALRQLSQLSGQQFDQAYMSEGGVNAHLENAATFQREAAFGQYPDLVRLANSGLPTINQHFTTASSLTNYRFAQVPQRFNGTGVPASQNPTVAPRSNQ